MKCGSGLIGFHRSSLLISGERIQPQNAKMIHPDEGPNNFFSDKFENLVEKRKLRPAMKSKNVCFKRSRGHLHINNLPSSTAADPSRSTAYYSNLSEDSELKLALMNLIPRNTAQETSEGVQELIKHVTEFIGKKNPFKDGSPSGRKEKTEAVRPPSRPGPSSRHSIRSHASKDTLHSSRKPKSTGGDRKVNKTVPSAAAKSCRDTVASPTSESQSKPTSNASPRCVQIRKRLDQPESKCEPVEGNEVKVKCFFKTSQNPPPKENTEKNSFQTERKGTEVDYRTEPGVSGKSSTTKKLRPSEIPLRKNRPEVVTKAKQTSQATMKTVKDANVTTSAHVNAIQKSGANISREIQQCVREIDKENLESSSSRRMVSKDKYKTADKFQGKCGAESSRDISLGRSTKSPNSPELSNHSSRGRMLDLEQVRSSTFTVLTSLSNTLHRLESIHQQNIDLKENGSEKVLGSISSKLKILTPKSSFNLLKAKGSKKSLSLRLSSKGNKPGLKIKRKKSKTKLGTDLTPGFHGNVQTGSPESSREVKNVAKPIPPPRNMALSRNEKFEREKQNRMIISGKKIDETSFGCGFPKQKAIAPKVTIPANQAGLGTATGFNHKVSASFDQFASDKPEDDFKPPPKDEVPFVQNKPEISNHILAKSAPSSEPMLAAKTPIDRRKSDAVIVGETTKTKPSLPTLIEEKQKSKKPEASKGESKTKTKSGDQTKVKKSRESSRVSARDLKVAGTALKLAEDRSPDTPEEKVQLKITIDVNSEEDCSMSGKNKTEDGNSAPPFDWLYRIHKKCDQVCQPRLNDTKEPEQQNETTTKMEIIKEQSPPPPLDDVIADVVKDELAVSKKLETELEKHYREPQIMKRRPKYKTPNKMNKAKADTKVRSGLTRSIKRDSNIGSERRDQFDDINSAKLRRRNSEPFSFRGFIWRHQDAVPPRGNKASASSLCSSLKHLNTDDLEDFIFWESVPQRVTSCWETSLYHFKRPWSVLSCSVFKDNRLSNTPGLILENIRNGNSSTKRWSASQGTERVSNSFDVEPSITQKNIDVRNWLAALNFQSPPSTSSDVIREGSVSPQGVTLGQGFKAPVVQKRRKVIPGLRSGLSESEENKTSKDLDKYNTEGSDVGLMELIRRKSGGFVTAEQYFNSNQSQSYANLGKPNPRHRSNPNSREFPNLEVLEDLEDSDVGKVAESEPIVLKEEKMVQVAFDDFVLLPSPPLLEVLENPSSSQDEVATPSQGSPFPKFSTLRRFLRGDTELVTFNVWKYLFMSTLLVLVVYYYVSQSRQSCDV